ncbi:YwdI family protein [Bacillus sp. FJAT-49711]|uniref:YwdI family protein n=1 Tax=Bacillus sp. FJAT-49711 TaxID=2833585 RepID=UPI001BC911D1|nr:YwdI family protein [Bacillus sp. FJAT-49711]MBS4218837.1 YwdI family protein [Bacillus sp. FJAT-49711]
MNISYKSLLEKLENEIRKAKGANGEQELKGHLYAVKALAELALEEDQKDISSFTPRKITLPEKAQTISVTNQERIKMEDGANGDSLFDF